MLLLKRRRVTFASQRCGHRCFCGLRYCMHACQRRKKHILFWTWCGCDSCRKDCSFIWNESGRDWVRILHRWMPQSSECSARISPGTLGPTWNGLTNNPNRRHIDASCFRGSGAVFSALSLVTFLHRDQYIIQTSVCLLSTVYTFFRLLYTPTHHIEVLIY